jgi:hypothetical protein
MKRISLALVPGLLLFATSARADVADRSGFTLELGLGIAHTMVQTDIADDESEIGLAPLSLSLGAFVTDRFAILARAAGTSYFQDFGGETEQLTSNFYGLVGEYWFNDRVFASAGAGLATFGLNPLLSDRDIDTELGLGLAVRGGYSFFTSRAHSLRASIELFPSFYDDVTTVGTAATLEWQLF